jgi:DNA-binding transcriptional LysR family regulator
VCARDLAGETVFITENGCGYRHLFEQELAQEEHYTCLKLEFNSVEAIQRCVAAGLGVGFLPQLAVQAALDDGRLVALRWEKRFAVELQLVWAKQKWLAPVEERFVSLCEE